MTTPLSTAVADIEARLRKARCVWLGLDFDGTLTRHVPDPHAATLWPGNADRLAALVTAGHSVAIITGRSIADVRTRVPCAGLAYAGNHGLEIEYEDTSVIDPLAVRMRAELDRIEKILRQVRWPVPVHVENKRLTLAVDHYEADIEVAVVIRQRVEQVLGDKADFFIHAGPHGLDIRPKTAANKGTAGLILHHKQSNGLGLPIVIGDDRTDEDLFEAFPQGISVRVGPGETRAHYRADGPEEIAEWLNRIVRVRNEAAVPEIASPGFDTGSVIS